MKRPVVLIVAVIALLLSLVMAVFVASGSETPNDPRLNPDANACYTGGSMAGKCKLDDELWIAGWYAIRLQYGMISGNQVPDQYKWLLPSAPDDLLPTPTLKPR